MGCLTTLLALVLAAVAILLLLTGVF
jgi:hypothetical protein